MQYSYEIKHSARKTLAIRITRDCKLQVCAPRATPSSEIEKLLSRYEGWIDRHMTERKMQYERRLGAVLDGNQKAVLMERARDMLPEKTALFAQRMGVQPAGVKITSAAARWGSCSVKNSICFSFRTMLLPESAVDYIVVHELAHILHKNHSSDFYALIERHMPDYRERAAQIRRMVREGDIPL